MENIKFLDKEFELLIKSEKIQSAISLIANKMNEDFKAETPIFLSILNGSFMFAADLFKQINFSCQISFIKLASYYESSTTGSVKELIGFNEDIKNKTVIILDDIVDTGITLEYIVKKIKEMGPSGTKVAALFLKPEAYTKKYNIDYLGMKVPNEFLVGFGLDYNGFGRNYKDVYRLIKS